MDQVEGKDLNPRHSLLRVGVLAVERTVVFGSSVEEEVAKLDIGIVF